MAEMSDDRWPAIAARRVLIAPPPDRFPIAQGLKTAKQQNDGSAQRLKPSREEKRNETINAAEIQL